MLPILVLGMPILMFGILGAWIVAAQSSVSIQSGTSAQAQTSVQTSKSGAQISGSGSATTSASDRVGKDSADISNRTKIEATMASSLDVKMNEPGDRVEAGTTQDVNENGVKQDPYR
jgi:hypothetical protein